MSVAPITPATNLSEEDILKMRYALYNPALTTENQTQDALALGKFLEATCQNLQQQQFFDKKIF